MISRRGFLSIAGQSVLLSAGLNASVQASPNAGKNKRPNVVFLMSDDQPQMAMGCSGSSYFKTPNMDRLAREGVLFENSFVTTSVCCVSRASVMTGQHMRKNNIDSFDTPLSSKQMDLSYPGVLRSAGYRTAFLGKYAIGHTRSEPRDLCLPEDEFDLWYGFQQSPSYAQDHKSKKRYITSVMEEKAIDFMKETPKDQPFLLVMCLPEPHGQSGPWNYRDPEFPPQIPPHPAPKPKTMNRGSHDKLPKAIIESKVNAGGAAYEKNFQKYMATVRDYIARTDLAVGRILDALKQMDIEDNTLVIFASDNGSMWGAHMLAGKWCMYEESIRVPLIIRDPSLPPSQRGTHRKQMALNIDWAPTMLSYAGVKVPETMQGIDLNPILTNPAIQGRKDWFYEHDVYSASKGKPLPRCEGVRTERWKYVRYKNTRPVQEELFDLEKDSFEEYNLASDPKHKDILAKLRLRNDHYKRTLL